MDNKQLNKNISDLLFKNLNLKESQKVIVIYDNDCKLTIDLKEAYEEALKDYNSSFVLFSTYPEEVWKEKLYSLSPKDLVILIQSTSFRISSFRIRLDLMTRGIICIEHVRLGFMKAEEYQTYINSLTYDYPRYQKLSNSIMEKLKQCKTVKIISTDDSRLLYDTPVDEPKSNIGDFSSSLGTLLPVGEVFTEAMNLEKVNGTILVHGFPSLTQRTTIVKPFKVFIENGCIVNHEGPEEFTKLLKFLSSENNNEHIPVREMGFGLNRFISKDHPLYEITSHERQQGYHMSLGLKHNVYRKKVSKKRNQRFHVDIFIDVKQIFVDDSLIFDREYLSK